MKIAATWSQPLTGRPLLLNKKYDVVGPVRKIEQRTPGCSSLKHLRNSETFDVDFSPACLVLRETYYTNADDVDGSIQNIYDNSGRCLRTFEFDSSGKLTGLTEFEHDHLDRNIGWTERDMSGTMLRQGSELYDGDRRKLSTITLASGKRRIKSFEYSGTALSNALARHYSESGELTEQWVSHYDHDGRLKETFGLTSEGTPLGDGHYTYEYDTNGRKSKALSFNEWGDIAHPSSISLYEYTLDLFGNWTERRHRQRFRSSSDWRTTVSRRILAYYENS